jgi:hypothetical protein
MSLATFNKTTFVKAQKYNTLYCVAAIFPASRIHAKMDQQLIFFPATSIHLLLLSMLVSIPLIAKHSEALVTIYSVSSSPWHRPSETESH